MNFFERYEAACKARGLLPAAQSTVELIGLRRSNVTAWKRTGKAPVGDTVARIADVLGVSCDYLLGRTDDPTEIVSATQSNVPQIDAGLAVFIGQVLKLDAYDRKRLDGYVDCLLSNPRYEENLKVVNDAD